MSDSPSDNTLVIPIERSTWTRWVSHTAMSVAAHSDGVTKFLVRPIPIDFFFAATSHKLQGETLKKAVIILIDKKERTYKNYRIQAQTGSKAYDAHKVYVACSRVRKNDHMRVIGEGYERAIEHISNNVRFKPALHAFMQAAVQRSRQNNFVVTLSEKIARLVYGGLLDAQKQREKREKRARVFAQRERTSSLLHIAQRIASLHLFSSHIHFHFCATI